MEIWKPVRDFPSYDCSNYGRIRNIRTQRILKTHINERGYESTTLMRNNEPYTVRVHRIVAETFLGDHPDLDVRHKDNDRSNNHIDNLYWSNRKNTIRDAFDRGTKKPSRQIAIRVLETGDIYDSIRACARATNCAQSDICKYLAGKCSHVKGLHFERVSSYH